MKRIMIRFLRDERGATAIEYGLIAGLIFLVIVSSVTLFAKTGTGIFNVAMDALTEAMK